MASPNIVAALTKFSSAADAAENPGAKNAALRRRSGATLSLSRCRRVKVKPLQPLSRSLSRPHSLGLFADLLHQLLDVVLHELDFLLLASQRLLQPDDAVHQHGLVHLGEAVHHHHRRARLALRRALFSTAAATVACVQGAWETVASRI